ncbi:hypothetical protein B0H15DRAFT_954939 [Mycena belliarum]|uniref:Uncharacterized protein n=1 Tax=Mycena belliarum TaxID=1033014 RepID=A0AAD6XGN5_9AGAR|nr:hypothetical protein B0H15DRAFT_954939 [Mycena belliae]
MRVMRLFLAPRDHPGRCFLTPQQKRGGCAKAATTMDTQPSLPRELEREIFKTAAASYPNTIPTLLRVAHRVMTWCFLSFSASPHRLTNSRTEPFLYRVVRVNRAAGRYGVSSALLRGATSKPPAQFLRAVRNLLLEEPMPWTIDETKTVLGQCSGLIELAIIAAVDPEILTVLAEMPLRMLSCTLNELFGGYSAIRLTHPAFAALTHLHTFDEPALVCAHIPLLPALTHIAFTKHFAYEMVQMLLKQCARLEVLLVGIYFTRTDFARKWAQCMPVRDPRFVVAPWADYITEWHAAARGLPHLWALADDFIARKRRGEIDPGYYWLHT